MSAHTPGPWFFEANTGRVVSADGETLAFASAAHESSLQNGRVLAAAPELLESLKQAVEALRCGDPNARMNALRDCPEIIAKAEAA